MRNNRDRLFLFRSISPPDFEHKVNFSLRAELWFDSLAVEPKKTQQRIYASTGELCYPIIHSDSIVSADKSAPQSHSMKYFPFLIF